VLELSIGFFIIPLDQMESAKRSESKFERSGNEAGDVVLALNERTLFRSPVDVIRQVLDIELEREAGPFAVKQSIPANGQVCVKCSGQRSPQPPGTGACSRSGSPPSCVSS
jgi:hypothetical protein